MAGGIFLPEVAALGKLTCDHRKNVACYCGRVQIPNVSGEEYFRF